MTQLAPRNFKSAQSVRNQWQITPEHNTPEDALLDPAYWAHVSAQLRPGDEIVAFPEDRSYWLRLLVVDAGKLFAKVIKVQGVSITASQIANVDLPKGYEIKFRGPKKWCVLRGTDVLKEDMDKSTAELWLKDHVGIQHKVA